ncbi:MAG: sensor histidine kinase [Flavobacteriales bacterium]|nr:sensor histidine kinase [Flavobacteriales bacterium]
MNSQNLLPLVFQLIAVLTPITALAENNNPKWNQNPRTKKVQKRTKFLRKSGEAFIGIDNDSILYYANLSIKHGLQHGDFEAIGNGCNLSGVAHLELGKIDTALSLLNHGFRIRERLGDSVRIASSYLNIGNVHYNRGVAFEDERNYNNSDLEYENAMKFYQKALKMAISTGDSIIISKSWQNVGGANFRLYNYEEALACYDLSYQWHPDSTKYEVHGKLQMNVISCQFELGNVEKAESMYNELVWTFEKGDLYAPWIVSNLSMAVIQEQTDRCKSIQLLMQADSVNNYLNNAQYQLQVYDHLYELHKKEGNSEKALLYLEKYSSLNDSLSSYEHETKLEKLKFEYKNDKNLAYEKLVSEQTKSKNFRLTAAFVGTLITTLILSILFLQRLRMNKLKRQQEKERHNQVVNNLIQKQELVSIQSMLEGQEKERKRISEDLHDRLGSTLAAAKMYLEVSLEDTKKEKTHQKTYKLLDQAIEDTRSIAYNLMSGALSRFGLSVALENLKNTVEEAGRIKVVLNLDLEEKRFPSDVEINIYRIIQETFSNSLKHANAKTLIVDLRQENSNIFLDISDDGKGFNPTTIKRGMGINNIEARISKLNGELNINSTPGNGTKYQIKLYPK